METKKEFDEMVAYNFSNLNVQQESNDNCFTCDNCDNCDEGCDECDGSGHCDCNNCNTHNN